MLKFYFDKRIIVGLLAALAILFSLAYLSHENKKALVTSSDSVAHTLDVLFQAERVLNVATNLELGQRGFTITGNDTFLITFNNARVEIDQPIETLNILTLDNPRQQQRVAALKQMMKRLLQFSQEAVETRKADVGKAMALNASLRGKLTLDSIRLSISDIQAEEHRLLKIRTARNQAEVTQFNRTFIYLVVAITVLLLLIFYAINVNLKARVESEARFDLAMREVEDLYNNAPCGYHSLNEHGVIVNVNNTLCNWLGYSREELIGKCSFITLLNDRSKAIFREAFPKFKIEGSVYDLEFGLIRKDGSEFPVALSAVALRDEEGRFVKSRAVTVDTTDRKKAEAEILNLNRELEAFTYSVSHDLRAPLRSIDGYARILQEDYSEKLDTEGNRVINVIMNNAKRMGKLIDDLLEFARLGRKELQRSAVDMTGLVNSIKKELIEEEKGRIIDFKIDTLHSAPVDIDMIKQVWLNLLSNAIKYTGKTSHAQIEISSQRFDHRVEYRVKDNGVGFDMTYVAKLFGVFQRLHRIQDFSGTGVGLAIVKRIVEKHHGKVWAEGRLNEGATFYFSIPILTDANE
ncbi:MAG TPA: CHASE3 domain-containing protein [Chryseosolibacter sp.]